MSVLQKKAKVNSLNAAIETRNVCARPFQLKVEVVMVIAELVNEMIITFKVMIMLVLLQHHSSKCFHRAITSKKELHKINWLPIDFPSYIRCINDQWNILNDMVFLIYAVISFSIDFHKK